MMQGKYLFAGLMVITLFLGGCIQGPSGGTPQNAGEIQRFASYEELLQSFERAQQYGGVNGFARNVALPLAVQGAVAESTDSSAGAPGAVPTAGGSDYSTTNVQVQGVDEADIVKTDGKYIYNVVQNQLIITDAYPIEGSGIAVQHDLGELYGQELFVQGDVLLVFGWMNTYYEPQAGGERIAYPYYGGSATAVQLYDISDRSNPRLEKELEFEGSYLTSRLIGDNVYFVVNSYPRYYALPVEPFAASAGAGEQDSIIPTFREDGVEKPIAVVTDIAYIPPTPAESFVTVASLNLNTKQLEKETIAGSANTAFASANNIYLSTSAWVPPEIPGLQELIERITDLTEGSASVYVPPEQRTIVNKFHLDNGSISFIGQGRVPGHVLNQFSMDEYEGNFRVAVTVQPTFSGIRPLTAEDNVRSRSVNNLYVMDENMEVIGSLEDLAPGESIFSVRFVEERAYMVTFRKVDPLFVIDTADPTNPRILGTLKIPGFSDYLHPLDADHIIGVGKEAEASKDQDFAWYLGMKMAIFDVSDVENPIEQHRIVIGDRGTDSYALRDHKAFLFDAARELLVIPIQLHEIPETTKEARDPFENWPAYGEPVFQGAFVYRVTLENGFEERGRITHITDEQELKRGYYWDDRYSVRRALFIEEVLYTLSNQQLQANDLDSLEELKEFVFDLPEIPYPYYDDIIGIGVEVLPTPGNAPVAEGGTSGSPSTPEKMEDPADS